MKVSECPRHVSSIVVPVYNEGPTSRSSPSGFESTFRMPAEILVIYDFPEDDTLPAVRRHEPFGFEVRLVQNRKRTALQAS